MFISLEINWKKLHKKKEILRKREAKWANIKPVTKTQNIKIEHSMTSLKMSQNKSKNVQEVQLLVTALAWYIILKHEKFHKGWS